MHKFGFVPGITVRLTRLGYVYRDRRLSDIPPSRKVVTEQAQANRMSVDLI